LRKSQNVLITNVCIFMVVCRYVCMYVIESPTRGDAILDVYLVRPESSFTSSSIVQGISDHHGVILEVDWEGKFFEPQLERVIPVYNRTDVLGLQTYLRDRFAVWQVTAVA